MYSVIGLGLPLVLVEFSLGRFTRRNPVAAIDAIKPKSTWRLVGFLGIATAFFILSYYLTVCGWTIGFAVEMARGVVPDLAAFSANPIKVLGYMLFFQLLVIGIVVRGVRGGIEKCSRWLMFIRSES